MKQKSMPYTGNRARKIKSPRGMATLHELAALAGVSVSTLYTIKRKGALRVVYRPASWLIYYDRKEALAVIEAHKTRIDVRAALTRTRRARLDRSTAL